MRRERSHETRGAHNEQGASLVRPPRCAAVKLQAQASMREGIAQIGVG